MGSFESNLKNVFTRHDWKWTTLFIFGVGKVKFRSRLCDTEKKKTWFLFLYSCYKCIITTLYECFVFPSWNFSSALVKKNKRASSDRNFWPRGLSPGSVKEIKTDENYCSWFQEGRGPGEKGRRGVRLWDPGKKVAPTCEMWRRPAAAHLDRRDNETPWRTEMWTSDLADLLICA